MLSLLNDGDTYKEHSDPTPSMERKLNSLLLQLKKKGAKLYNSSGGLTPFIYGLPKIHKPDTPSTYSVILLLANVPALKIPIQVICSLDR